MPPSLKPFARPRILLIDDDRLLMERTAVYLKAKGFLVTSSENVFSVASTIGSEKPDAIVLDVRMPALGGDKVASVLSRMCSIPIVFYSAIDDEDGETLAAGYENAHFVSKGSGLRRLWERLVEITGVTTPAVESLILRTRSTQCSPMNVFRSAKEALSPAARPKPCESCAPRYPAQRATERVLQLAELRPRAPRRSAPRSLW